jgi:SOS-response transcriptional repressor LexA
MGHTIPATPHQMDLLRYIVGFIEVEGRAPKLREMQHGLGRKSHSGIWSMLRGLEERGHIRRIPTAPGVPLRLEILSDVLLPRAPDDAPLYFVPVKSRVDHGVDHE